MAPDAPQNLSASPGDQTVHLSWSAPASDGGSVITSYRIYRGTASGAETALATTSGPVTSFQDTPLTNGTTYYYKVAAINDVDGSTLCRGIRHPRSADASRCSHSPSATGAPGGIDLAWTAPASNGGSAITGYRIYRGTVSGTYTPLTTLANLTSYTDTTATAGTQYFYAVAALNAIGEGAKSNERSGTASAAPAVPGAPQQLRAEPAKGKGIALDWLAPLTSGGSSITSYRIYRATSSGGQGDTALATVTGGTTYRDLATTRGSTYYYTVKAVNIQGEGAPSNEASTAAR